MQTKLLINGEMVAGEGSALEIVDPATGQEIAQVPKVSEAQVGAAVSAATQAFDGFSRSTPGERAAPIAAGCSMVLKPSEIPPFSTLRAAELLKDVLPKGVLNVIHGRGSTIGDVGRAMRLFTRLRYGFTWVNTHGVAIPEMSWAAMKGSGTGYDMSVYALDAYTSVRHVMVAH